MGTVMHILQFTRSTLLRRRGEEAGKKVVAYGTSESVTFSLFLGRFGSDSPWVWQTLRHNVHVRWYHPDPTRPDLLQARRGGAR